MNETAAVLINAAGLGATLGIILSVLFSYFPALKVWFANQTTEVKSSILIGLLALVAAGTLVYQCAGVWGCVTMNWGAAGVAFVSGLVTNQATYLVSPQTPSVKRIKRAKDVAVLQKLAREMNTPVTASSSLRDRGGSIPPRKT